LALTAVRDLRELRAPATEDELADFETDVLSGFVLARASAGLVDSTIRNDVNHLELIRDWFGRPLWEMQPSDADTYFGKVLRDANPSTRTGRASALTVYFHFLELRHKVELHNLTDSVVECPLDEILAHHTGGGQTLAQQLARAVPDHMAHFVSGNWRPAHRGERVVERGGEVGRGIRQSPIEIEDDDVERNVPHRKVPRTGSDLGKAAYGGC